MAIRSPDLNIVSRCLLLSGITTEQSAAHEVIISLCVIFLLCDHLCLCSSTELLFNSQELVFLLFFILWGTTLEKQYTGNLSLWGSPSVAFDLMYVRTSHFLLHISNYSNIL